MTKDPTRIPLLMAKLQKAWEFRPEDNLISLISRMFPFEGGGIMPPSDKVFEKWLDAFIDENRKTSPACLSHPKCSHNTNGRSLDKPCSIEI